MRNNTLNVKYVCDICNKYIIFNYSFDELHSEYGIDYIAFDINNEMKSFENSWIKVSTNCLSV